MGEPVLFYTPAAAGAVGGGGRKTLGLMNCVEMSLINYIYIYIYIYLKFRMIILNFKYSHSFQKKKKECILKKMYSCYSNIFEKK